MFDGAAVVTAADAASVHVDRPVGSSASHAAATWDGGARSAGGGERATKTSAPAATHEPERRDDGCAPPPCADASDAGASDADAATPTATLQLVASSEGTSGGDKVVPGEVLRYRMVVAVPEGSVAGAELRLQLAPGLRFVADDTTTVALVSDDRGLDSSRLSGTRLDVTGGGDGVGSIASIVPLQRLQGDALVGADGRPVPACTVLDAGDGPRILLGDLDNLDRDCGAEFVVVEFDAVVDNAAGNVRGDALPVSFSWVADGAVRAVSNTVEVCVGEPSIVDLDARVVEVTGTHVVFEATFGNSGDQVAHDVRLVDAFDASSGLGFGGAWTVSGLPQGAINASTADTLDLRLPTLAPGETVTVRYDACLADAAAPAGARDVVVTYTSLSECGGELTVAADGGSATSTTTGERTGDTTDYGGPANVYRDVDRVALGAVSGTLWNDTPNADGLIGATEARLPGVTVTLTLSGPDGALGSGDDLTRTAITDASGFYAFGATPAGALRVTAPTLLADAGGATGALRVRTDARGDPTDATMDVALAEGATVDRLDVGYVQLNRAPTVTAPERATVTEDVRSALSGVSIGDADADAADALTVTLGVDDGRLDVLAAGGVGVSGNGTASLVLTGPIAAINATLGTLGYTGSGDASGCDTLTVRVDDRGHTGDADGDGMPSEPVDDALDATTSVDLSVVPANEAPLARADARTTPEGVAITDGEAIVGSPRGDVADSDGDGDGLVVIGVSPGTAAGAVDGGVGVPIATPIGTLTLQPDGRYTYVPTVDLPPGGVVQDVFTYTIADASGARSTATITVTVFGTGGAVSASPDARTTTEDAPPIAGNAVAGEGADGGAPGDRRDVDAEGDRLTVVALDALPDGGAPRPGTVGSPLAGTWGTLTLQPDGRYTYATAPAVQTLLAGQTVVDRFRYSVTDGTSSATTTLTVTIVGVDDAPTAGTSTQIVDQLQPAGSPGPRVIAPPVADVDDALEALTVRVDAIDRPQSGVFLRPDGTPLAPGDAITVDTLRQLTFRPTPGYVAPPLADGTLPGSGLAFTVADPSGATAPGRIDIALRPPTADSSTSIDAPPAAPPAAPPPGGGPATGTAGGLPGGPAAAPPADSSTAAAAPPVDSSTAATVPVVAGVAIARGDPAEYVPPAGFPLFPQGPTVSLRGDPLEPMPSERVGDAVRSARDTSLAELARLDDDSRRSDLDADGLLPSTRAGGLFGDERIGPLREASMPGAAPVASAAPSAPAETDPASAAKPGARATSTDAVAADDDCVPAPPKPRPKPVKRILPDGLSKPAPSFSEQIDVQKKKFRPPAKVVPTTPPARQC